MKQPIKISRDAREALEELYYLLEPDNDPFVILEMLKFITLDEESGLGELDEDAIRFYNLVYRLVEILRIKSNETNHHKSKSAG